MVVGGQIMRLRVMRRNELEDFALLLYERTGSTTTDGFSEIWDNRIYQKRPELKLKTIPPDTEG